nr:type ISP restriction/modification enzyme [Glutamicibacter arilaitensis]
MIAIYRVGVSLAELHINYEDLTPYPLGQRVFPGAPENDYERFAVTKMNYGGKAGAWDKTKIRYNPFIDIDGIPVEAQEYMLGSRSGLDWILGRYQVKTDKSSGITDDPNEWAREHEQPSTLSTSSNGSWH